MNYSLVVLAAGIGSRYGGLKQMDPVGPSGEFILDYSVYDALRAGANQIVFVIRREIEDTFRAIIGDRIGRRAAVKYVCQDLAALPPGYAVPAGRQKPWGTGHAVLVADGAADGPFVVANADDFYGRESFAVLFDFLQRTATDNARYAMAGFVLRNTASEHGTVARGVCQVDARGRLVEVVERTDVQKTAAGYRCTGQALDGGETVSMNLWGLKPSLFAHLRREFRGFLDASAGNLKAEFFLPSVVNTLLDTKQATVDVLNTPCKWFGTTYAEDKAAVVQRIRTLVADGTYPANLWA